jgi:crossover junction endodeoxyribonuclease RuvC
MGSRIEPVFDPTGPVLGIDPGVSRCGYGAVAGRGADERGSECRAVAFGVLRTPPDLPLPERLGRLQTELEALIEEIRPSALAVERVLFQVNVRTAMSVGQASGIVMAEAASSGCEVVQYSPNEVKQAVTGYGAATKEQVQIMVQTLLGLATLPQPADAADAAALALTHLAMATSVRAGDLVPGTGAFAAATGAAAGRAPRSGAGRIKNAVGRPPRPAAPLPGGAPR